MLVRAFGVDKPWATRTTFCRLGSRMVALIGEISSMFRRSTLKKKDAFLLIGPLRLPLNIVE